MSESVGKYKEFIDELVSLKESMPSEWVLRGRYPDVPENSYRNEVLGSLSEEQRAEVAKMIQEAKSSGIHDLLALMNDKCSLIYQGVKLPGEPFGTELNYDFVARSEGDEWPQ